MIFNPERIAEIHQRAIAAGLHATEKRNLLLFGVAIEYVARLPALARPSDQLLSDLQAMSTDGWVAEIIPLAVWLRNAVSQTQLFPDRANYFAQRADEAGKTPRPRTFFGGGTPIAADPAPAARSPADRSGLDPADKLNLIAAIAACLTVADLQAILQKCFGDLPNLYGAPDQAAPAVRDVALQSIELVEREKLTVVFLHFMLSGERCSDELRQAAIALFPELEAAGRPFAAIVDAAAMYFAQNAASVAELLGEKDLANQLVLSVKELKCYKGLHEAIHQVKNNPVPLVPEDTGGAKGREFRQELRQYLALLNTARGRLQDALDELPADSPVRATQQSGITLVGGCAKRIESALARADIDAMEVALEDTARTIDPMLDEFNQHIIERARRVLDGPLDLLRNALAGRTAAAGPAVNAMDALRLALRLRVLEHTRWQEVDNSLFSLGGAFRFDTSNAFRKFTRRWGVARRQIPILTNSDAGIDTGKLKDLARKVDNALVEVEKAVSTAAGGNEGVFDSVMLEPFDEFRFETQQQFLRIDSALKRNCADLVRVVTIT